MSSAEAQSGLMPGRPLDWVLTEICGLIAADIAEMEERAASAEQEEDKAADAFADAKRRHASISGLAERWGWMPVLGARLRRDAKRARQEMSRLREEMRVHRREGDDARRRQVKASISHEMLLMLAQREYCVPDPMPDRTRRFLQKFQRVSQDGALRTHVYALASEVSEILGDWAAASLLHLQKLKAIAPEPVEEKETALRFDRGQGRFVETDEGYAKPSAAPVARRIYLPVPRRWEDKVVRAGGRIDDSTVNHVMSRVWVGFEEYERFEEYLPRAYRKSPPELDFEELHLTFSGAEFRLAKRQESRLRADMGERQGWRCSLCGSYGGLAWDRLRSRHSPADAEPLVFRSQWTYRRIREHQDIGLAKLEDVLLICRDCDLAFDEARLKALIADKSEALREHALVHLRKRRMMLLRCEESALSLRERQLSEHLDAMRSMSRWVLDLSLLNGVSAVFAEGIEAPERAPIAGITIVDAMGEVLSPARSVEAVVADMTTPAFDPASPMAVLTRPAEIPSAPRDDLRPIP